MSTNFYLLFLSREFYVKELNTDLINYFVVLHEYFISLTGLCSSFSFLMCERKLQVDRVKKINKMRAGKGSGEETFVSPSRTHENKRLTKVAVRRPFKIFWKFIL